jgi:Lamin Tail Domain/CHU_C Type IX secretion signal domain
VLVSSVQVMSPTFKTVLIKTSVPLDSGVIYSISRAGLTDCSGSAMNEISPVRFGLPKAMDSADVIINEILFNPATGGYDFLELYNRSTKVVDIAGCSIAQRDAFGNITTLKLIPGVSVPMLPDTYVVLTQDPFALQQQYPLGNYSDIVAMELPSFNDDKGNVVFLNKLGNAIDAIAYDEDWHYPLLELLEGISLERLFPGEPALTSSNWHSAAETVGFATPGYKNSQHRSSGDISAAITIDSKIISPNQDGSNDFCVIRYQWPNAGTVLSILLFSTNGDLVTNISNNHLCGISGSIVWNGLDANKQVVPSGMYIIYTEAFTPTGDVKRFKNVIVVAGKT